jgi:hypothetical protein
LGRNHAQAKYKGIYRIQALDADSSHLRGLIRLDNIHATRWRHRNSFLRSCQLNSHQSIPRNPSAPIW